MCWQPLGLQPIARRGLVTNFRSRKLHHNILRFRAYRWIAFDVGEQDEPLHGIVDLQSASDILNAVWPKGQWGKEYNIRTVVALQDAG